MPKLGSEFTGAAGLCISGSWIFQIAIEFHLQFFLISTAKVALVVKLIYALNKTLMLIPNTNLWSDSQNAKKKKKFHLNSWILHVTFVCDWSLHYTAFHEGTHCSLLLKYWNMVKHKRKFTKTWDNIWGNFFLSQLFVVIMTIIALKYLYSCLQF